MKPTSPFTIGQCWMSEGEPELGMGFVMALDELSVAIQFPTATQARMYRKKTAPLRRLEFRAGEKIQSKDGVPLLVERLEVRDGLIWYIGPSGELCESELSPKLTLQRPMERFLAGHWDPLAAFELRRKSLDLWHRSLRSPARGMIGPRAHLLPHQLYVAQQIANRGLPRALLADEVGLGKTIEAGWIMHRLLITGRIRRVLVIVPEALVNQWFVELFKRFNLSFWVPASQGLSTDEDGNPREGEGVKVEAEDLAAEERVILSMETLGDLHADDAFRDQKWDLIVVDEAHRIPWTPDAPSVQYEALAGLARQAPGLLLLTATPEQLGLGGHFARLHLIDPQRFPTLEAFQAEHDRYREVVRLADRLVSGQKLKPADLAALRERLEGKASPELLAHLEKPAARRSVVLSLIDHYGTGRVYFRNSRAVVQLEHCAFPKRKLERHVLQARNGETGPASVMTRWLGEFAQAHRKEKCLLICSSAKRVIEWEKKLKEDYGLKAVAFHEQLSLLARDRNAAYFEDPQGASILLSSEIGGEGRNFQHASHLILADLPADPDTVEQRIGRLDRIGQASDITLHVPYAEGSLEERRLNWHDQVFDAFTAPPKGAGAIYAKYRATLEADAESTSKKSAQSFGELIKQARADYESQLEQIEAGRDRLIEINSFDPEAGPALIERLEGAEQPVELRAYLEELLNALDIHSDDLDADSMFVEPGNSQYVSYLPGLPPEGLSFTFSRKKALARHDLALMTWDHPLVNHTLETVARQEFGNVSVAAWPQPLLVLECSFVLEPSPTQPEWYADEFFPSQPLRVVLEATGKDLTAEWDWETLRKSLSPLSEAAAPLVRKLPGERIRGLLNKAVGMADRASTALRAEAQAKMTATVQEEIARLQALRGANELVSQLELDWWTARARHLQASFEGARVRLDAFLLVVPAQLGRGD